MTKEVLSAVRILVLERKEGDGGRLRGRLDTRSLDLASSDIFGRVNGDDKITIGALLILQFYVLARVL